VTARPAAATRLSDRLLAGTWGRRGGNRSAEPNPGHGWEAV